MSKLLKKLLFTSLLAVTILLIWGYASSRELYFSCAGNLRTKEITANAETEITSPSKISLIIEQNNHPFGGFTSLTNEYGYFSTSKKEGASTLVITRSEMNVLLNQGNSSIFTSFNLITKDYISKSITRSFAKDGQSIDYSLEKYFEGSCTQVKKP